MKQILACCALLLLTACGNNQPRETIVVDGARSAFTAAAKEVLPSRASASQHPVKVQVALVDRYGRETTRPVVTMTWPQSELDKVNWSGFTDSQLANLAHVRIESPYGVIAFAEWCGDYASLTPRLCQQERRRAEDEWALQLSSGG